MKFWQREPCISYTILNQHEYEHLHMLAALPRETCMTEFKPQTNSFRVACTTHYKPCQNVTYSTYMKWKRNLRTFIMIDYDISSQRLLFYTSILFLNDSLFHWDIPIKRYDLCGPVTNILSISMTSLKEIQIIWFF